MDNEAKEKWRANVEGRWLKAPLTHPNASYRESVKAHSYTKDGILGYPSQINLEVAVTQALKKGPLGKYLCDKKDSAADVRIQRAAFDLTDKNNIKLVIDWGANLSQENIEKLVDLVRRAQEDPKLKYKITFRSAEHRKGKGHDLHDRIVIKASTMPELLGITNRFLDIVEPGKTKKPMRDMLMPSTFGISVPGR